MGTKPSRRNCADSKKRRKRASLAKAWGCKTVGKTIQTSKDTPWKINIEPENDGLEDDFPFQLGDL